ncbi:hypothetical protein AAMO2058_001408100 [Amorphochlora amoebiformis]
MSGDESDDSMFNFETLRRKESADLEVLFNESGGSNVYGILTEEGVQDMLDRASKVMNLKGKVFCDVGSGNGEAIMCAMEQFPQLSKCLGIELSEYRHKKAQENLKTLVTPEVASKIELRCQDGLKADYKDCDVLYVSNLLAEERFNIAFSKVLDQQLRPGSLVFAIRPLSMCRGTESSKLTGEAECSWGTPIVHGYVMGEVKKVEVRSLEEGKSGGETKSSNPTTSAANTTGAKTQVLNTSPINVTKQVTSIMPKTSNKLTAD